ncbi:replication initiator protein A [Lactiplantibacillus plantarum]|uniref:replication initiator protein A n=1 Tax=Lactiplantibacillus plantarum TaxID=1590 RepID=UPI002ADD53B7|nr:replication initiator protein A [Lactiplantibacillus plantarum]MEA0995775.1 replication initiator protein A [Lactiplantibacillus plantarum]MEA1035379.1 replication initiator protein A [Lactiplantibacillus plantarum]
MTKSTDFNYYDANSVYGALFFQFPKVLMYGEQYKHLSSDAKLAYMVLKDRLEYSLRNNWVDEDGNIYFVYTNAELMELFNSSEKTVIKIKKELEGLNLLRQKRMGFQPKAGKQLPNRLYLASLDVQATDVYLRGEQSETPETLAGRRTVNSTVQHDTVETLAGRRTVNSTVQHDTVEKDAQTLAGRRTVNSTVNLDKELKERDTNRYNIDTQKLDFSTANFSPAEIEAQNRDLVKHADEFLTDEDNGLPVFLEPEAVQLLSFWCRTPQQMRRFIGIILNAKYAVEKEHKDLGVWILLDDPDLKKMMTKTLRRYFNALRSDEKHIKNVENYLYGTMQNLFGVWWNQQAAREYAAKHPEEQNTDNEPYWN